MNMALQKMQGWSKMYEVESVPLHFFLLWLKAFARCRMNSANLVFFRKRRPCVAPLFWWVWCANHVKPEIGVSQNYCWWFRNPVNSPVEVGSWNPIIYKVLAPSPGRPPGPCKLVAKTQVSFVDTLIHQGVSNGGLTRSSSQHQRRTAFSIGHVGGLVLDGLGVKYIPVQFLCIYIYMYIYIYTDIEYRYSVDRFIFFDPLAYSSVCLWRRCYFSDTSWSSEVFLSLFQLWFRFFWHLLWSFDSGEPGCIHETFDSPRDCEQDEVAMSWVGKTQRWSWFSKGGTF